MSVKSKSSDKVLDKPFARKVITKARVLARQYQIILDPEDGEWYGRGLELPNVFGQGRTEHQCVINTREALTAAVATMIEVGQTPPAPAKQGMRTMQINIRLTPEEKVLLEASAKSKGFRGISDLMRAAALAS